MKTICVISKDATYGNAAIVARGLNTIAKTKLVLAHPDKKEMHKQYAAEFGYKNITDADKYVIIGAITIDELIENGWMRLPSDFKNVTVILTDTRYVLNKKKFNIMLRNSDVFAMPDLIKYRNGLPTKVFYQPFDIKIPIEKNTDLTIAHSPFHKSKFRSKGTQLITDVVTSFYDVKYSYITGMTWENAIKEKAKAHIFIDQVNDGGLGISNGIGKSGLEAMLLDCLVISSGQLDYGDIPPPPVVMVTRESFKGVLGHYIRNPIERRYVANEQFKWAKKYLDKELCAKRILSLE